MRALAAIDSASVIVANAISTVGINLVVNGSFIDFLSIPNNNVEYDLAIHPLRWLRFVIFCITGSGAHGDIFATWMAL